MKDITSPREYTYEKFILYIYLAAAYSDFNVNEEEEHFIKDKVLGYQLIAEDNFEDIWFEVLHDFKSHNDYTSMEHIRKTAKELDLDEQAREKIIQDVNEIMMADGVEEDTERINLFKLKKILGV